MLPGRLVANFPEKPMLNVDQLDASLDPIDGHVVDVSKIEFEVLENGTLRWLLWEGAKRIYGCTLERADLTEAMKASCVLLRTMQLALREESEGSTNGE